MPADAIVEVKEVGKIYDSGVEALTDVDVALPRGRLSTLLGPSGCGKTTLLKIIAGLIPPSAARSGSKEKKSMVLGPSAPLFSKILRCCPGPMCCATSPLVWSCAACRKNEREQIARKHIAEVGLTSFRVELSAPAFGRHAPAGRTCARA